MDSDQNGFVFRSRGCVCSIASAADFAKSHYKIAVERGGRTHFILLDERQLVWLGDVLQVATSAEWKIPARCVDHSLRRTVVVSTFWRGGVRFLNIVERCRDRKCFFIDIPAEEHSTGWKSLLGLLRSFSGLKGRSGALSKGGRIEGLSFAEVVSPGCLNRKGECVIVRGRVPAVVVSDMGVEERLRFLRTCLVIRNEKLDSSLPDWSGFRVWASKSWGVDKGIPILAMGDDLWLMCCSQEAVVLRARGVSRFAVSGIPLHLRSDEVLRKIASLLGERAVVEDIGSSLNEVRVRVRSSDKIPEGFWMRFGEMVFWLKVAKIDGEVEIGRTPRGMRERGRSSAMGRRRRSAFRKGGSVGKLQARLVRKGVFQAKREPSRFWVGPVELSGRKDKGQEHSRREDMGLQPESPIESGPSRGVSQSVEVADRTVVVGPTLALDVEVGHVSPSDGDAPGAMESIFSISTEERELLEENLETTPSRMVESDEKQTLCDESVKVAQILGLSSKEGRGSSFPEIERTVEGGGGGGDDAKEKIKNREGTARIN
ncbi:hypothetical protein LINPERHAP2_LOCUS40196 [Linum perenne]